MGERTLGAPDFFKGLKDIEGKIRCVPHNAKEVEPGLVGGASGTQTSSGQGSIWGSQSCRGCRGFHTEWGSSLPQEVHI